jgi:hypothetical protein
MVTLLVVSLILSAAAILFFRKKPTEPIKIEDFIRSLLELVITAQPVDVLSLKSEFDTEDLSKIQAELNNFRVVLLFLLLLDKSFRDKVSISEEDMGFEIGRVVAKKAAVAKHDKNLAIEDSKEWMTIYFDYLQSILAHGEKEITEKGIYFYACVCFAAKVSPGMNPMVEAERLKNFALVDAAKQVYSSIHKVFVTAQKTVRIQPYVARQTKQSEITNKTPDNQTESGRNVGCGIGKDEVVMSNPDRLFCKTPGCSAPHMACDAGTARALLQAQLRTNPNQKYKFDCERCSKTTEYNYSEIMQRIPVEKRPKACPEGEFWAFVLLEIPTSDKMLDRAFFGEPIRLRKVRELDGDWYAKLVTTTRFLQGCLPDDLLVGYRVGKFNICSQLFRKDQLLALPLVSGVPQGSEFALFFQAKKEHTSGFRSGTLFCANPSCVYPFQLTHTQFLAKSPTATQLAQDPDASYMILLTCPKCGTVRQVDEKSFENIVHI